MFIFLLSTCIQNFSNWHALFVFLSHSVAVAACSGYSLSTHRWSILSFFITWCARASSTPNNIFFSLGSWEKDILGIHPKTIIIPASFHSKILYCSTTWDELGVTWLTWRTKERFFLPSHGPCSNLKNFNQLLVTLSGLGFLTMWELSRRVSFFVSSLL